MIIDIESIRGDTLNIQFSIDTELNLESKDIAINFSVKSTPTSTKYLIQVDKSAVSAVTGQNNTYTMRIAPLSTSVLPEGYYSYDLQLTYGEDIYTIAIGTLHIIQDITN